MSYYRDTYLKSGHWKMLRASRLIKSDYVCDLCHTRSASNDVHHIRYGKSLWTVSISDLRVLCRGCHNMAHNIEESHPEIDKMEPSDAWREIFRIITDPARAQRKKISKINRDAQRDGLIKTVLDLFALRPSSHVSEFWEYIVYVLSTKEARSLEKAQDWFRIKEHGRRAKYYEYTETLMRGGRLERRTLEWLGCEVRRRRKNSLPMILLGLPPIEDDGPDIRSFSASPDDAPISTVPLTLSQSLFAKSLFASTQPPPHDPHSQRQSFNGTRG